MCDIIEKKNKGNRDTQPNRKEEAKQHHPTGEKDNTQHHTKGEENGSTTPSSWLGKGGEKTPPPKRSKGRQHQQKEEAKQRQLFLSVHSLLPPTLLHPPTPATSRTHFSHRCVGEVHLVVGLPVRVTIKLLPMQETVCQGCHEDAHQPRWKYQRSVWSDIFCGNHLEGRNGDAGKVPHARDGTSESKHA